MRLAIFDFDGTLYRGETMRLFLRVLSKMDTRRRRAVQRYYLRNAPAYLLYKLGLFRLPLMTLAARRHTRLLVGLNQSELEEYFQRCLEAARPGLSPAVLARLRAHLAAGDRVVILSGAYAPFLEAVARELGVDAWLGTALVTADGRCAGMGPHLVGPGKIAALRVFLAAEEREGRHHDLASAYAYADGAHDLSLLKLVGHPVAVRPDRWLRKEAERKGWEILGIDTGEC
ncbi:MAG: HAD family hydrolase [Bacteroidota bacterium]